MGHMPHLVKTSLVALALTTLVAGCDSTESDSPGSSTSFREVVTYKPSLVAEAVEAAYARGDLANVGDLVIDQNCGNSPFATVRMGEASVCGGTGATKFLYVGQPGSAAPPSGPLPYNLPAPIANAPPVLTVVVAKNIRLTAGKTLYAQSGAAIVLFALETITIEGTLDVGSLADAGTRGAGISPLSEATADKSAGAGGGPSADRASKRPGGGATFCGRGGNATATAYGNAELLPLVGGSDGGSGVGKGGAGGGAVALIAGRSVTIAPSGVITSPGNGGGRGDFGAGGTPGLGGGSGGAILLEAPTVTVSGVVAANGGNGGGPNDTSGERGASSGTEIVPIVKAGGIGSAGTRIDGSESAPGTDGLAGGGGGGAGRIRINGATVTASGTVSPALTTTCGTQGGLATWSSSSSSARPGP